MEPTTKQIEFIKSIENVVGVKFNGQTKSDASSYISKYVDSFREKLRTSKMPQKRKYKWFIVAELVLTCEMSEASIQNVKVYKGLSARTVINRLKEYEMRFNRRNDTGGYYSATLEHYTLGNSEGYSTEDEAKAHIKEETKKARQKLVEIGWGYE